MWPIGSHILRQGQTTDIVLKCSTSFFIAFSVNIKKKQQKIPNKGNNNKLDISLAKGFNFCQLSGVAESLRFELPKHVIAKRVLTTCVAKNYQGKNTCTYTYMFTEGRKGDGESLCKKKKSSQS